MSHLSPEGLIEKNIFEKNWKAAYAVEGDPLGDAFFIPMRYKPVIDFYKHYSVCSQMPTKAKTLNKELGCYKNVIELRKKILINTPQFSKSLRENIKATINLAQDNIQGISKIVGIDKAKYIKAEDSNLKNNFGFEPMEAKKWRDVDFPLRLARKWSAYAFDANEANKWEKVFKNPSKAKKWRDAGIDTDDAKQWNTSGFSPQDATKWKGAGVKPGEAKGWISINVYSGDIGNWKKNNFSIQNTLEWKNAHYSSWDAAKWRDAGYSATEPKEWIESGFTADHAKITMKWKKAGFEPDIAFRWHNNKFSVERAIKKQKIIDKACKKEFKPEEFFNYNPFDLKDKCVYLEGKTFQILSRTQGLFEIINRRWQREEIVYVDFGKESAPPTYFRAFVKGRDPFKYLTTFGAPKIIPYLEVIYSLPLD